MVASSALGCINIDTGKIVTVASLAGALKTPRVYKNTDGNESFGGMNSSRGSMTKRSLGGFFR